MDIAIKRLMTNRRLNEVAGLLLIMLGLLGEPVDCLVPNDQREAHPALRRAYAARPTPRPISGNIGKAKRLHAAFQAFG